VGHRQTPDGKTPLLARSGLVWRNALRRDPSDAPQKVKRSAMIKLTRLTGDPFVLNAELIRYVEQRPDTFITLTNGDRMVVLEDMDEVLRRAIEYQRTKHLIPPPAPTSERLPVETQ
jgi:flagellar protein FlbD